jgi:penicillin-binding protein 2
MNKRQYTDLDPNEIFLDSSNIPRFDKHQLEGRIEKSISKSTYVVFMVVFLILIVVLSVQSWSLQIKNYSKYSTLSVTNRLRFSDIFSERGLIYDRNNLILAENYTKNSSEDFMRRKYIEAEGLAHVLGFVKYPQKDNAGFYYSTKIFGLSGVEKAFDSYLSGLNGLNIVETDALGKVVSKNTVRKPEKGRDIHLTIDANLTEVLFQAIKNTAKQVGFSGGAGIIMDVHTGEVLALTSYPEFNSQVLTEGKDISTILSYNEDRSLPYLNRAVGGLYSPGSTVKLFLAAAALNEGIINPNKKILSTGYLEIPNPYYPGLSTRFNDWKAHGEVDMRKAIAVSSNVYFYEIGGGYKDQIGLGINRIEKYARMFGYGSEINGSPFFNGPLGTIPNPAWKISTFKEKWVLGDTYHTSIGQYGFEVTPLQNLRMVAAVANGGFLVSPIIAKEEKGLYDKRPLAINPAHFEVVKEGMRLAVKEGTAKGIYFDDLSIAAKTGTAEIDAKKLYVNSWIVGFFPYDNPKYAFVVVMERGPRHNTVGALYVMRQTLAWMKESRKEYFLSD